MGENLRQLASGIADSDSTALSDLTAELLQLPGEGARLTTRAAFLLGDPALVEVGDNLTAPAGTLALQESQRISGIDDCALVAGANVVVSSQADARSVRLGFQVREIDAVLETHVRFLTPETIHASIAPKLKPRMLGQGGQAFSTKPLSAIQILRYTTLAHDPNPLHADVTAAQEAGFADVIAPGMLLCALAEMAFAQTSPQAKIHDLRARFLSPTLVDTPVQVIVSRPTGAKSRVFVVSDAQDIYAIVDIFTDV